MEPRFSLSVLLVVLWLPPSARALPPTLSWDAPAECPDAASVQAAIARQLPADADLDGMSVRAQVVHAGESYRLDLTMQTATARTERRLHAERCATFVALLALELGVAASLPPAGAPSSSSALGRPARTLQWGAQVNGGVGSGPGPQPAPRVGLAGVLRSARFGLELSVGYDLPREVYYTTEPSVGARLALYTGRLRACGFVPLAALELPLCGGLEAGAWRGEGLGIESSSSRTRAWMALSAAAGVRYPRASRLALFLEVSGLLSVLRPTFGIHNLPALYRPPLLAVRGTAGLELHFD